MSAHVSRWDDFKATLRELFSPIPDDTGMDPDAYAALLQHGADVRTEWVRKSRVDEGG